MTCRIVQLVERDRRAVISCDALHCAAHISWGLGVASAIYAVPASFCHLGTISENPERWSITFQPEEKTETAMLNTIMGANPIHSFSALDRLPEIQLALMKDKETVVDVGLLIARLVSSLGRVFSVTLETPSLAAQLRNRKSCCYLHKEPAAVSFDLAGDLDTNDATRLKQGAMRTSIAEGLR